jgi:hypothetical protein
MAAADIGIERLRDRESRVECDYALGAIRCRYENEAHVLFLLGVTRPTARAAILPMGF